MSVLAFGLKEGQSEEIEENPQVASCGISTVILIYGRINFEIAFNVAILFSFFPLDLSSKSSPSLCPHQLISSPFIDSVVMSLLHIVIVYSK